MRYIFRKKCYLEFGAAHSSIGSVVILSRERPLQSTPMITRSTTITGMGWFAQNVPHLEYKGKKVTNFHWLCFLLPNLCKDSCN